MVRVNFVTGDAPEGTGVAGAGEGDRLTGLMRAAGTLAVVTCDRHGTITDWSEGAERLLGHRADEVVGVADLTLGHDLDELAARAAERGLESGLALLLADGRAGAAELREWSHVRRDGRRFPAARAIAPILDDHGVVVGFVALGRDVSRRRRDEDERAALHRVATAAAAAPAPETIFAGIAAEVGVLLGGDIAGVSRFHDEAHSVVGIWPGEVDGSRFVALGGGGPLPGPGTIAAVHRTHRPVRLDDVEAALSPDDRARVTGTLGFRAIVASPVTVEGRPWGAVWVGSERVGAFGPEDEERLARFSDLIAMAIASAEARERVVGDAVSGMFRGDLDIAATIGVLVTAARRAMSADRSTCYVIEPGGGAVIEVHTTEADPRRRAFLESARGMGPGDLPLWRLLLASRAPTVVIEDLSADNAVPAGLAGRLGTGALVCLRLEHPSVRTETGPELLGTLFLSYRTPRRFSERERSAAESLAGMAALALANTRLHAEAARAATELQAGAMIDPLTGLANHRAFQDRLAQEVARATRHGRSLSLALIDIDHFRRVNEEHGHEAGDVVLAEVAALLRRSAREPDLVARVGGEELAWLMPETAAMEAWQAVDRAREALAGIAVAEGVRITVSAGVCDLVQAGSAPELLRLAEGALYWAKQHGRDVAFLYSPAVVEELSAEERADRLQRVQALQSIRVLARAVDAKDPSTREHSERVADLAVALATALGWDADRLVRLREAGLVHDVGKIGVPDRILFKPARLTAEEYEEITRHAAIGSAMVADVLTPEQVAWVRGHHERWDGGGYPDGIAGAEIPEGARVLALADAWDVMTSERPYHEPLETDEALAEIRRCAGAQFDTVIVTAMERLVAARALPGVATA